MHRSPQGGNMLRYAAGASIPAGGQHAPVEHRALKTGGSACSGTLDKTTFRGGSICRNGMRSRRLNALRVADNRTFSGGQHTPVYPFALANLYTGSFKPPQIYPS